MTVEDTEADAGRKCRAIHLDRHTPAYWTEFRELADEYHARCPVAWNDTHANIVAAVLTMAMLGLPLSDWVVYCEPAHAPRVRKLSQDMGTRLMQSMHEIRHNPRPGLVDAVLRAEVEGEPGSHPDDLETLGVIMLLIGGGFDTATEEFLRFYTPAQGDGRAVCDPDGAMHCGTAGIINGIKHLPAAFTRGKRVGPGLVETIAQLQEVCDEQQLAAPVTVRKRRAELS